MKNLIFKLHLKYVTFFFLYRFLTLFSHFYYLIPKHQILTRSRFQRYSNYWISLSRIRVNDTFLAISLARQSNSSILFKSVNSSPIRFK